MPQKRAIHKKRLSALFVAKVQPQARAFLVWDSDQKGLALQVRPSGHAAFKLVYRYRGRSRWFHIGDAKAIGLADARTKAAELMLAVVRDGKDPAGEKHIGRQFTTFGELAGRYLTEHAQRKNKSWKQADAHVRRRLLPVWGELDASAISRADVRAVLSKITGPVAANQTLAAASAIFSWAAKQELLTTNPCRGIERNATAPRERTLSDTEIRRCWEAFGNAGMAGVALRVLLLVGQRPGEVAHMRREHIVDGWWELPGLPQAATGWPGVKNAKSHSVWLSQPVRKIIAELNTDGDCGFVFGQVVWDLSTSMRHICRELEIARATPHDLRRTFCSKVTELGFGRAAMDRLANHKESGVTDTYDRYSYRREDQQIMESVAKNLLALVTGETDASSNVVQARF